jgi:CRISPR-associated protein Csd1
MSTLASLVRAYDRMATRGEVPIFGYSTENISFLISLNADGSVAGVPIDLCSGDKKAAQRLVVPQPAKRSSGIAPNFLWDNTAYILGIVDEEKLRRAGKKTDPERIALQREKFIELHREWLKDSDDVGMIALLRFQESWNPHHFAELGWPEEMRGKYVAFALESDRLDGVHLHDRPAARQIWARCLAAETAKSKQAMCLVTGEMVPVERLHPAIKGVRDAQSTGASIVSFNLDAFSSYGREQGDNAPVSEAAAFAYTTVLNRFLQCDSRHCVQIGDASTVFWAEAGDPAAASAAEDFFAALIEAGDEEITNQSVKAALEKIRAGRATADIIADLPKGVRFYILGLAPNASRLSIRFYLEDEFGVMARRWLQHVERLRIEPSPNGPAPSMWRMLIETAALRKSKNIQPNLAGNWMRAILTGTPYPLTLLSALVIRIRADRDINALRAGMLKSILIRNYDVEVPVALDQECTEPGYLLGRLFALYEQVQTTALGRNVNATIKDKYYGSASAQPRKVFHHLEAGSANHLAKIGKRKPGLRVYFEKQISTIMDLMQPGNDPFPARLPEKSQAMFGIGYYHQRNFRKPSTSENRKQATENQQEENAVS